MKRTIHFTKMHGAGNDYIYVDASVYPFDDPAKAAVLLSDRNKGIGGDGLVLIGTTDGKDSDFSMRIFNADGSEADMCGNASRCIGKYVYEKGLTGKNLIRLQTASGVTNLWLKVVGGKVESVTVDMLEPALESRGQFSGLPGKEFVLDACGRSFKGMFVSMGNPHFVTFCPDADTLDVAKYGSALEYAPVFPSRCNIEFAKILSGACATTVAASLTGRASKKLTILMDGGDLEVDWNPPVGHVYLSGPAEFVYEGDIEITI